MDWLHLEMCLVWVLLAVNGKNSEVYWLNWGERIWSTDGGEHVGTVEVSAWLAFSEGYDILQVFGASAWCGDALEGEWFVGHSASVAEYLCACVVHWAVWLACVPPHRNSGIQRSHPCVPREQIQVSLHFWHPILSIYVQYICYSLHLILGSRVPHGKTKL